jgi:hypothetical protein
MPQPRFDRLSERLLRAGIAPRHVRRYVRELSDHFDDLCEMRRGAARDLPKPGAGAWLGHDDLPTPCCRGPNCARSPRVPKCSALVPS